jgi:hypothetical protein
MAVCLEVDPPELIVDDHRVFCHAVTADGRLPLPRDLPVLEQARRAMKAESQDMELVE